MISPQSFTRDWQTTVLDSHPGINQPLLDKMIHAFHLLSILVDLDFDFVFKGGTSLVLVMKTLQRLSIDLDIVGAIDTGRIEAIPDHSRFSSIELDEDRSDFKEGSKSHFRCHYQSEWSGKKEHILLDVIEGDPGYKETEKVPIESEFFEMEQKKQVAVPTVDELIGDKLTAFAPSTVGVPFGSGQSLQIAKQMFDVARLLEAAADLKTIARSYKDHQQKANKYRGTDYSVRECLLDTIRTASLVANYLITDGVESTNFDEVDSGIKSLGNFLLVGRYNRADAVRDASRVALLSTLILIGKTDISLALFDNAREKVEAESQITGPLGRLNHLKKTEPESFYYWHRITNFMGNSDTLDQTEINTDI